MALLEITRRKYRAIVDDDVFELIRWFEWRDSNGYVYSKLGKINIRTYLHHFVVGRPLHGLVVDHINHNPYDNRRSNLRIVTTRENCRNRKPIDAVRARTPRLGPKLTPDESKCMVEIKRRYENESLREIQNDYPGVSLGTLMRIRDGHVPTDPKIRAALKLSIHRKKPRLPFADRVRMSCGEADARGILAIYEFLNGRVEP
jgi:hypothetical protein